MLLLPQSSVEKFTFFFSGPAKKIREESNHPMRSLRCKRQRVWGSLGRKKKRKKKKKKNINVVVKEIDRYKGNCRGHETPNTWLPGLPHSCSKFPQTLHHPNLPKNNSNRKLFFSFFCGEREREIVVVEFYFTLKPNQFDVCVWVCPHRLCGSHYATWIDLIIGGPELSSVLFSPPHFLGCVMWCLVVTFSESIIIYIHT